MRQRLTALLLACVLLLSLTACEPGADKKSAVSITVPQPCMGQTASEMYDSIQVSVNGTALERTDSADATYGDGTQFTVEWWKEVIIGWDTMAADEFFSAKDPDSGDVMYYGAFIQYAVPAGNSDPELTLDSIGYAASNTNELSEDGKWKICSALVSFEPSYNVEFDVEQGSLFVPTPAFGETVEEISGRIDLILNNKALSLNTGVPVSDSDAAYSDPSLYADGTKFIAVWWGYNNPTGEEGMGSIDPYSADHVFSEKDADPENLKYDSYVSALNKYMAMIYYALPAEYNMASFDVYDSDQGYTKVAGDNVIAETDGWTIHCMTVTFGKEDSMSMEASINVPKPVFGETCTDATANIEFILNGQTLTPTSSNFWEDTSIYENGTKFSVAWWGSFDGMAGTRFDDTHVFQPNDTSVDGDLLNGCFGLIFYAVPAEYDYVCFNPDTGLTVVEDNIYYRTDEWVVHEFKVAFSYDDLTSKLEIEIPEIRDGETVAEVNAGIRVTVNELSLGITDAEKYDSLIECRVRWYHVSGEKEQSMSPDDKFLAGSGETYRVYLYYSVPISEKDLNTYESPYEITYVIADSGPFAVMDKSDGVFATDEEIMRSACGANIIYTVHDHTFGEWTTTVQGSCTKAAEMTRTCTSCGYTEKKVVEPEGHTWSAWVDDQQATCTAEGSRHRTCTTCRQTEIKKIAALGHSYTYTRTVGNYHKAVCSRCGDNFEEKCTYNNGSRCIYCGEIIIVY